MLRVGLREGDVERLGAAACSVLEDVGAMFQNEEMLGALEQAGARVDRSSQVARFPRRMVADFVEGLRRESQGGAGRAGAASFRAPGLPGLGTQVAQFVYDYDRQERRAGNRREFIELIKLGDGLHPDLGVGHCLLLRDVPPLLEPLEAALALAEYAHRPGPVFAWSVAQEEYLREMHEILGLGEPFTFGAVCIAHPLRFDREVADRYVRMIRAGQTAGLTAMPVAGLTTPVTVEGFIAVASAEQLASWVVARALNAEASLGGSMWAGTCDLKTGQVSFSAFDAMFYGIATVQFLEQWCGVRVAVGGGEYCAAKQPGLYAALEKAYKAMTIAAFTGRHPEVGSGMVDDGKVLSDVQLLLDRELSIGVQHYAGEIDATAEQIGLPAVLEVGMGEGTNYLWAEHTARHFRESLWFPSLIDRTGWDGFAKEAELLRKARERAKSLTSEYAKPEGREDLLLALRAVVERARKDLLSERS